MAMDFWLRFIITFCAFFFIAVIIGCISFLFPLN